jgi:hypothetical protein
MEAAYLVRDLLDSAVKNEQGVPLGRVDSVVLDVQSGRPPRVTAIEIGPSALGNRLHPAIGRLALRVERWLGIDRGRPVRVRVEDLRRDGLDIVAPIHAAETGLLNLERKLRAFYVWRPWR